MSSSKMRKWQQTSKDAGHISGDCDWKGLNCGRIGSQNSASKQAGKQGEDCDEGQASDCTHRM
jgi:hypothetical protein